MNRFSWYRSRRICFQEPDVYWKKIRECMGRERNAYPSIDLHMVDHIIFTSNYSTALFFMKKEETPVLVDISPVFLDRMMEEIRNIPYIVLPQSWTEKCWAMLLRFFQQIGSTLFFMCFIPLLFRSLVLPHILSDSSPSPSLDVVTGIKIKPQEWIGAPEVYQECLETVQLMNSTETPLRGLLLEGDPGVGKTLLARHLAYITNASFFPVTGSQFIEVFAGVGAQRVRQLFREARKESPSIIFIDEIDTIGSRRYPSSGSFDESVSTLNQILAEMDGFHSLSQVLVIGATNRIDVLDRALLRPGRFDRVLHIPLPDDNVRRQLFHFFLSRYPCNISDQELEDVIFMTQGFSGADIESLVKESRIMARRQDHKAIDIAILDNAIEKKFLGLLKIKDTRSEQEIRRVAIHECGHALLVHKFPSYFHLQKISIRASHQNVGGFTIFHDLPSQDLPTLDLLKARILILLGGRVAEEIYYGRDHLSVGSQDDLTRVNSLLRVLHVQFGFSESLPHFSMSRHDDPVSPFLLHTIESDIQQMLENSYQSALDYLQQYRPVMDVLVYTLLREKSLSRSRLSSLLNSTTLNLD